jgi:hypothetical protein
VAAVNKTNPKRGHFLIARRLSIRQNRLCLAAERLLSPLLLEFAPGFDWFPFKTLAGAEYTAQHIAGARLIRVPSGGHLLMGGLGGLWTESAHFLTTPASVTP